MRRRKNKTLSYSFDQWFLISLFLLCILLMFLFLLIKERLFLVSTNVLLDKYKLTINSFSNFNAKINSNSHLLLSISPSSSYEIIYLAPESYTLK